MPLQTSFFYWTVSLLKSIFINAKILILSNKISILALTKIVLEQRYLPRYDCTHLANKDYHLDNNFWLLFGKRNILAMHKIDSLNICQFLPDYTITEDHFEWKMCQNSSILEVSTLINVQYFLYFLVQYGLLSLYASNHCVRVTNQ